MSKTMTVTAAAGVGAIVGFAVTVLAAVSAVGYAMVKEHSISVPGIIDVSVAGQDVSASSGAGILVPTLLLAVCGALVGITWVGRRARRD